MFIILCLQDVFMNCGLMEDAPCPAFFFATTTRGRTQSKYTLLHTQLSVKIMYVYICLRQLLIFICSHSFLLSFVTSAHFYCALNRVPFWRFLITGADQNQELKMWCTVSWTCLQTIRLVLYSSFLCTVSCQIGFKCANIK